MSYHLGPAEPDEPGAVGYGYDEPQPGRSLLRPLLLVLVMAGFAGGLWFAYSSMRGRSPDDVPLIRADDKATKARPEQPGGMAIPNQDKLVYGQGRTTPVVEKLLPPPETPLPRPAAPPEPPPAAVVAPPVPGTVTQALPVPASDIAAMLQAAPLPPGAPLAQVPAAPIAPVPVAPIVAPVAAAPAPAAAPAAGGFRLQLAALRSEDAARKEWGRIKQANKDLLGAYGGAWPRADLGARGVWYRLQAGPVADGAAAERICNELKRRNVGCMLVRP